MTATSNLYDGVGGNGCAVDTLRAKGSAMMRRAPNRGRDVMPIGFSMQGVTLLISNPLRVEAV